MWKSVCVHLWTLKIYQFEGTVLVLVRIFVKKMITYRSKRWISRILRRLNIWYWYPFPSTSTFIKLVNSVQTSRQPTRAQNENNKWGFVTISFCAPQLDFAGTYKTGGINSVETTRLARTETRHDFLVHEDLLRVSLYERQGGDSVLVPQQTFIRRAL